jgi:hypothetical protein
LRIGLLDLAGICEHDAGKIARGGGAVDVPAKTLPVKIWKITAMIDVRVAQDGAIDLRGIKLKAAVPARHLLAMSLKETALHKDSLAIHLQKILGTRGGTGRPEELDLHKRRMKSSGEDVEPGVGRALCLATFLGPRPVGFLAFSGWIGSAFA